MKLVKNESNQPSFWIEDDKGMVIGFANDNNIKEFNKDHSEVVGTTPTRYTYLYIGNTTNYELHDIRKLGPLDKTKAIKNYRKSREQ
jgi:hypothetical protein